MKHLLIFAFHNFDVMQRYLFTLLLVPFMIFLWGCHHNANLNFDPPRPTPPPPGWGCSFDTIYFQNSVLPVILTGCAKTGCHDQGTRKSGLVLDNYAKLYSMIVPFNPQNSKLYKVLYSNTSGRMPPDKPLSDEGKSIIYWWIKQGGYNNRCDSTGCDSTNVTYTRSINPILQSWCVSCHSGSSPGGGFKLETYDEAKAVANGGRLMGALRHDAGYSPMPKPGTIILSPCEINMFAKWIRIGEPQ